MTIAEFNSLFNFMMETERDINNGYAEKFKIYNDKLEPKFQEMADFINNYPVKESEQYEHLCNYYRVMCTFFYRTVIGFCQQEVDFLSSNPDAYKEYIDDYIKENEDLTPEEIKRCEYLKMHSSDFDVRPKNVLGEKARKEEYNRRLQLINIEDDIRTYFVDKFLKSSFIAYAPILGNEEEFLGTEFMCDFMQTFTNPQCDMGMALGDCEEYREQCIERLKEALDGFTLENIEWFNQTSEREEKRRLEKEAKQNEINAKYEEHSRKIEEAILECTAKNSELTKGYVNECLSSLAPLDDEKASKILDAVSDDKLQKLNEKDSIFRIKNRFYLIAKEKVLKVYKLTADFFNNLRNKLLSNDKIKKSLVGLLLGITMTLAVSSKYIPMHVVDHFAEPSSKNAVTVEYEFPSNSFGNNEFFEKSVKACDNAKEAMSKDNIERISSEEVVYTFGNTGNIITAKRQGNDIMANVYLYPSGNVVDSDFKSAFEKISEEFNLSNGDIKFSIISEDKEVLHSDKFVLVDNSLTNESYETGMKGLINFVAQSNRAVASNLSSSPASHEKNKIVSRFSGEVDKSGYIEKDEDDNFSINGRKIFFADKPVWKDLFEEDDYQAHLTEAFFEDTGELAAYVKNNGDVVYVVEDDFEGVYDHNYLGFDVRRIQYDENDKISENYTIKLDPIQMRGQSLESVAERELKFRQENGYPENSCEIDVYFSNNNMGKIFIEGDQYTVKTIEEIEAEKAEALNSERKAAESQNICAEVLNISDEDLENGYIDYIKEKTNDFDLLKCVYEENGKAVIIIDSTNPNSVLNYLNDETAGFYNFAKEHNLSEIFFFEIDSSNLGKDYDCDFIKNSDIETIYKQTSTDGTFRNFRSLDMCNAIAGNLSNEEYYLKSGYWTDEAIREHMSQPGPMNTGGPECYSPASSKTPFKNFEASLKAPAIEMITQTNNGQIIWHDGEVRRIDVDGDTVNILIETGVINTYQTDDFRGLSSYEKALGRETIIDEVLKRYPGAKNINVIEMRRDEILRYTGEITFGDKSFKDIQNILQLEYDSAILSGVVDMKDPDKDTKHFDGIGTHDSSRTSYLSFKMTDNGWELQEQGLSTKAAEKYYGIKASVIEYDEANNKLNLVLTCGDGVSAFSKDFKALACELSVIYGTKDVQFIVARESTLEKYGLTDEQKESYLETYQALSNAKASRGSNELSDVCEGYIIDYKVSFTEPDEPTGFVSPVLEPRIFTDNFGSKGLETKRLAFENKLTRGPAEKIETVEVVGDFLKSEQSLLENSSTNRGEFIKKASIAAIISAAAASLGVLAANTKKAKEFKKKIKESMAKAKKNVEKLQEAASQSEEMNEVLNDIFKRNTSEVENTESQTKMSNGLKEDFRPILFKFINKSGDIIDVIHRENR